MTFVSTRTLALLSPIVSAAAALLPATAVAQHSFATLAYHPASYNALFSGAASPSSSSTTSDVPAAVAVTSTGHPMAVETAGFQPFSTVAVTAKVGSTGVGVDVATPLARHFGLRSGFSFFSYNTTFTTDGLNITGAIKLQNASSSLDIYPFHNSFRISPGVSFANHNRMSANLNVPGGQNFTLNDQSFVSSPSDPVHGAAAFNFGGAIAPRLTMGWGNIIPRKGNRISFPVELGFQYTAQPTVKFSAGGTGCTSGTYNGVGYSGCAPVNQSDLAAEQQQIQTDLNPLRFYPIASLGVSVRFGHNRAGN